MNQHLQKILDIIQQSEHLSAEEKSALLKSAKDADKEFEITNFKLDRTEKVKKTTAILLEETIEELEQKRKAVEAQNKELEIESSLERVRTVAMSMNHRDDMLLVCRTISEQLGILNVKEIRNVQTAIFYEEKGTYMNYEYYAKHNKTFITETIYTDHEIAKAFAAKMLKGKGEFYITLIEGKEKVKEWLDYQKGTNVFIDTFLETADSLNYYWFSLGPVALGISTYVALNDDALKLFKRFLNVFELAYRRYLDIEKAAAQAKEAQIETSLERVRAQAMAMRTPEDLTGICEVLHKELLTLGFTEMRNAMINIHDDAKETLVNYDYSDEIGKSINHLVYNIHPVIENQIKQMRSAGDAFSETYFKGRDLEDWKAFRKKIGEKDDPRIDKAEALYYYFYSIGTGSIGISTFQVIAGEKLDVLKRFRNVFNLSYQRYTDIAQAEAQAREAKIEAALERTRTQSMIMQHSNELDDTLRVFHQQVLSLGIKSAFSFLWLPDEEKDRHLFWAVWEENNSFKSKAINYPLDRNEPATAQCLIDWKSNEPVYSYSVPPEGVENYFAAWQELIEGVEQLKPEYFSGGLYYVEAFMKYGCFGVMVETDLGEDEKKILARFAIEFERTYTRFLDLQKAEAQAKEAQIESALERIRSRSLAMHHSSELSAVVDTLLMEFTNLKFTLTFCIINLIDEEDRSNTVWAANPETGKHPESYYMKFEDYPFHHAMWDAWKKQKKNFIYTIEGEEKRIYDEYLYTETEFRRFPKHVQEANKALKRYVAGFTFFRYSGLQTVSENHISDDELAILERFGRVFEQSYTRFLDLQKAEAQAREAQIELALERVRARTMAMQHSEELQDTSLILFEQLKELGEPAEQCTIGIIKESEGVVEISATLHGNNMQQTFRHRLDEPVVMTKMFKNWKDQQKTLVLEIKEEELLQYNQYRNELVGKEIFPVKLLPGDRWIIHIAYFSKGILALSTNKSRPAESLQLLERFAIVFEQTYTRFLDLQKAEAQAREAQIEAALERVRSRSMGMQKSEELKEVIKIVYQQLKYLKIDLDHAGFVVDYTPKGDWHFWIADEQDIPAKITHPYFDSVWANQFDEAKEKGADLFTTLLNFEEKNKFYNKLLSYVPGLPQASKDFYLSCPGLAASTVLFEHVSLYIENFSGTPYTEEENNTLVRFGKVFQQTYTRFLDLKKAEAQAKESQVEAALERVRSRTLAMQKSDELAETAAVLFQQLIALGIEPNRLYIAIIKDEKANSEFWITDEDGGKVSTAFTTNMHDNATLLKMFEGRDKQKSLVLDMQGEELQNYFRYLTGLGVPFKGGLEQKRRVQEIAYFSKGFIGMASPEEQPAETLLLLERFAAVFNLTFTRFNDLKIAEAHAAQAEQDLIAIKEAKQKAEDALAELQVTQKQLIQSEKMASLGELTAGIAHEIQNPLNFVNNFSEVSNELIDEMNAEIEKGDMEEAKAIANDIKQNLEKINHHGKRADAIVKGMLQHSRSSSATKEPTDINKLADEYLRLAYHGLRAKDKSFNASMKTDYDETIGNINVIPQDIGRVILNLITNAFYVVNEKALSAVSAERSPGIPTAAKYEPTVSVSTKKINNKVEIKVADNGNGIPQKVLDKIFQPFFTTKPAGQGTGLGLSLSYDIVKAHGGEIKVETKENEGTAFIIQLPIS